MTGYTPGVYDIPEAEYFADPALSCSGAKLLLPPSCPALFKWRQDHPEHKRVWDVGTAAHRLVLGQGADFVVIDADNYHTKKAQQARDEARAAGAAPVLTHEYKQILAMAAAIRRHPDAGALLAEGIGSTPEQSLFWVDEETGVPRRCRIDSLPEPGYWGRYIVIDYKTADHADLDAMAKAIVNYGYHMQEQWYLDGVCALGLDDDPDFLFVFQEKTPPYLVNIARIDDDARRIGQARNRQAIEIFRDCTADGLWPGYEAENIRLYDDAIATISLPPWAARNLGVSA